MKKEDHLGSHRNESGEFEPFRERQHTIEDHFANYPSAKKEHKNPDSQVILIIGQHRYYNQFNAQLATVALTKTGQLKNPMTILNPLDFIWDTKNAEEIKFYASIAKFQAYYEKTNADLEGLKNLIKNPLEVPLYYHDHATSDKISIKSIRPVQISSPTVDFKISIQEQEQFYSLSSQLQIEHTTYPLDQIRIRFDYFITWGDFWFFNENINMLGCIDYFIKNENALHIDLDVFPKFKQQVLDVMEKYVPIELTQPKEVKKELAPPKITEKLIYLSDNGEHVSIMPAIRYDQQEVPLRSHRQLYVKDEMGRMFHKSRDIRDEDRFMSILLRQQPEFNQQLDNTLDYFYLHKSQFLDEEWFIKTTETWNDEQISIYGFENIKGNKINPGKSSVTIQVTSGLDWFNTQIDVKFGAKKAKLKEVQKAVKSKSRFVRLDDGTFGILPLKWLDQLEKYLSAGELRKDVIEIPKINFSRVTELFDQNMIDGEVKKEIVRYKQKLDNISSIPNTPVPEGLKATLRPYQIHGLSWLNLLDDLNFGGCLADDMGLGKTLQIIAFILSMKKKYGTKTHLLVVPTSLIHNWDSEIKKFAPSLDVHIHHGSDRMKNRFFEGNNLIITTYQTMMGDIGLLKQMTFDYVFLDESQNIKNIKSQRYKATRMLNSRNRIVISGTPMENNSFDLYAQFSFANPGLLGSPSHFKNAYGQTIDKFRNNRSANELQKKISPFMLRRTKAEVAQELPEKTEMILYCDMEEEQRGIYQAYEREFRDYISASDGEEIYKHPMNVLRGITKLRQICDSPALVGKTSPDNENSSKILALIEKIETITSHHKVLVYSQFVSMLDLISQELNKKNISHLTLTGKTKNRGNLVDKFQNDTSSRVFLISLKAGGTGLNLTAADYVFLVDPWWNPAVENQAIDRCFRIGQKKNVVAVRMICPDTIEEKIQIMQKNKSYLTSKMVTSDGFFKSLTKDDLLNLTR